MKIKGEIDVVVLIDVKTDNITDYKKTSLLLVFPYCSNKCKNCQNILLQNCTTTLSVKPSDVLDLYQNLKTHNAIVMAGLEPFDSFDDVLSILSELNHLNKNTDIVIYTGYTKEEYKKQFESDLIKEYKSAVERNPGIDFNLLVKVGRYDEEYKHSWYSEALGVNLATTNQSVFVYKNNFQGYIDYYKTEKDEVNN